MQHLKYLKNKLPLLFLTLVGCSPLKSSPHEEKVQLELTLHELKTNLDDQRHDLSCFQTELQILDGRIKYYENALSNLKQQELEKQQSKLDHLTKELQALEKKSSVIDGREEKASLELRQLSSHANETTAALSQFKERIHDLEQEIQSQNRRFEELSKLKVHFEGLVKHLHATNEKTYKVRAGDSLEKIARMHKITVERLKKANSLEQDLIVVGQDLSIPE